MSSAPEPPDAARSSEKDAGAAPASPASERKDAAVMSRGGSEPSRTSPHADAHSAIELLHLDDQKIVETVERLQIRIGERFPDSGLYRLSGQLLQLSRQASERSRWIARPILWIRAIGYMLAAGLLALLLHAFSLVRIENQQFTAVDLVTVLEAGLNEIILIGAAIYFLISLETRSKRRRALAAIHELRSIAHVIDMHQLTKDPERTQKVWVGTESSPAFRMTSIQLNRYLDYCSEMLSLTGKIAALYVQKFDDSVSLAAVSEIEQLTTGLSRKIFQKIMILQEYRAGGDSHS